MNTLLLLHLAVVLHVCVSASWGVIPSLHLEDYIAFEVSLVFSRPTRKNGKVLGIHCLCMRSISQHSGITDNTVRFMMLLMCIQ